MTMFLFAACAAPPGVDSACLRTGPLVQRVLAASGARMESSCWPMPELNGALVTWQNAAATGAGDLSLWRDPRRIVLVRGAIDGVPAQQSAAEFVARRWTSSRPPLESLRRCEGSFTILCIDPAARAVWLSGDRLGRESTRYFQAGRAVWIASHDLPLVASGQVELDFDATSIRSHVELGWSLGGKSLITSIQTLQPDQSLAWQAGRLQTSTYESLDLEDRRRSTKYTTDVLEASIEHLQKRVSRHTAGGGPIVLSGTTATDSAAVLALVQAVASHDRITLTPSPCAWPREQHRLARLARQAGCRFAPREAVDASAKDERANDLDAQAIWQNGLASPGPLPPLGNGPSSGLALPPRLAPSSGLNPTSPTTVVLFDQGGAWLRGEWQPRSAFWNWNKLRRHAAALRIERRLGVEHTALCARLHERLLHFADWTTSGHDLIDLFTRFELGQRERGVIAGDQRLAAPLGDFELLELASRLPPPLGRHGKLTRTLVRRYLSRPKSRVLGAPQEISAWMSRLAGRMKTAASREATASSGRAPLHLIDCDGQRLPVTGSATLPHAARSSRSTPAAPSPGPLAVLAFASEVSRGEAIGRRGYRSPASSPEERLEVVEAYGRLMTEVASAAQSLAAGRMAG